MRILTRILVFALFIGCLSRQALAEPITNIDELVRCTYCDNPKVGAEFAISGKVTYKRATGSVFAVRNGSESVVLYGNYGSRLTPGKPTVGDIVTATGVIQVSEHKRASLRCSGIEVIGHATPDAPYDITAQEMLSGRHDFQFTRLTGRVRDIAFSETNAEWLFLTLISEHSIIYAGLPYSDTAAFRPDDLVGAKVSVEGVCLKYDLSFRVQQGRVFKISGPDAVRILEPAPADPFNVPDVSLIRDRPPMDYAFLGFHRAVGHVIASWRNRNVLIRGADGTLVNLKLATTNAPAYGVCVEAAGLPETDFYHLRLTRCQWRRTDLPTISLEEPENVEPWSLLTNSRSRLGLSPAWQGRAVKLTGTVREISEDDTPRLTLENGTRSVAVDASSCPNVLDGIEVGSTLAVAGTCVLESESYNPSTLFPQATGFFIAVRSPSDLTVLSEPPWWTPRRLWTVIGILLLAMLGILIWNATLRQVAVRKGRELFREQLGRVKADLRTEERTRLAVELHDTLAQNLTGVSMEIEAANDLRGHAPQPMLDHLGIAAKALKSCRDELRNCLWDLRSQALEERDMNTAILRTLQPHVNDSRIAVRFNVPRAKISDNTAHALLRVIRELVINAIRHGNATAVKVAGSLDPDVLRCSGTDDGCGFDPETAPGVLQGHFGLQGIRERIDELGGTLVLDSVLGKGSKATITIPLPKET